MYTSRFSFVLKSFAVSLTSLNDHGMNLITLSVTSSSPSPPSTWAKNFCVTDNSALCGQSWNQSIEVQLISAGKRCARRPMSSPTGLKHRHMCRFCCTLCMKKRQQLSGVSGMPAPLTRERTPFITASISSCANNPGMSPLDSKSFRYTRNFSSAICASVNRKQIPSSFRPAFWYMVRMSSLRPGDEVMV